MKFIYLFNRKRKQEQTAFPIVLYMDVNVSQHFSYACWKYCKAESVIVQCFPPPIHKTYRNMSLGLFEKVQPEIEQMIQKR